MDDDDGYSTDEVDVEAEEETLANLRSGRLIVRNAEGTFRCPLSPNRKKQAYAHKDLLQHANGVAKGKRGGKKAGEHRALATYLNTNLAQLATPPVPRVHRLREPPPQRTEVADLFVFPWCGVIYNIETHLSDAGQRVGPGDSEIREHFRVFNPERVSTLRNIRGHTGCAVIGFRASQEGLKDALAFEKWLIQQDHGRRDWERRRRDGLGSSMYGWLARKEDHDERRDFANNDDRYVARYLRENGHLTDVESFGDDQKKVTAQQFRGLRDSEAEARGKYHALFEATDIARRNAEIAMNEKERKHKEELEEAKNKWKQSNLDLAKTKEEDYRKLQASMEEMEKRCKELESKEQDTLKSQADRLEQEKRLVIVNEWKDMQRKSQEEDLKVIQEALEQTNQMEERHQREKLKLVEQQQKKLRVKQLGDMIDTEKFNHSVDPDVKGSSSASDLELKLRKLEEEKAEFEEQLQELKEENDVNNTTINALSNKERSANQELEDAKQLAMKALARHKSLSPPLCIKRMGEINEGPWIPACKSLYKNHADGWATILKTEFSKWENVLLDHNFRPFKNVNVGQDKWEVQYDESNAELETLKSQLGEDVWRSVLTAYEELEVYNASGRYPVPQLWNSAVKKKATLSEIVRHFVSVIDTLTPSKKRGVKRPAASRD